MNFSRTTSYSLNTLLFMVKSKGIRISATTLHEQLDIPYSYLRQVMGNLSRKGLVKSTKGRNGGFVLSRTPSEITLAQIIESTEGLESFDICIMGFRVCPFDTKCPMHDIWEKTRTEMLKILRETTLKDLIPVKTGLTK